MFYRQAMRLSRHSALRLLGAPPQAPHCNAETSSAAARFDCKTLTTSFRHLSFPFLGVMACISLGFGQIVLRNSLQLL